MGRGDGRVFQRGTRWWIAYYAPDPETGKRRQLREPGGDTEREAKKSLRSRLAEVEMDRHGLVPFVGPEMERVTVRTILSDLQMDYDLAGRASLPQLRSRVKRLKRYFGATRAIVVSRDRISAYMLQRQGENAKPATINREIETLRRAYALAVEGRKIARAPVFPKALTEANARRGFFERADFLAVLAHIRDADVRDFLDWFYWTGMRPGEIRSLTWDDLDRETWTLRLHESGSKTGEGRAIVLEGEFRTIMHRRLKRRRVGVPVIFHRKGKPMGEFRKTWKTACQEAGVSARIPYDLRRSAIRNMIRAGVSEVVAMRISGHKTRNVFDRYNVTDEADLRKAQEATERYVSKLPKRRRKGRVVPMNQTR